MQNWDSWLTVLSVVETGTLSGAAAQLRIDATTIGRRLSRLETKLGRRLLVRRGGRLEPTAICRALLPRVEEAAQQLESGRRFLVGERIGWDFSLGGGDLGSPIYIKSLLMYKTLLLLSPSEFQINTSAQVVKLVDTLL